MSDATPEAVQTSENGKSRKPKDTPFKQQQLKACRPILTAVNVMPLFLAAGIAFIPIGIGMLVASNNTKELEIDYTDCTNEEGKLCHEIVNINNTLNSYPNCTCEIFTKGTIGTGWTSEVRLYYGITNFFQNHRSYVRSRDDNQLLGVLKTNVSDDCKPFASQNNKNYIPCGSIANSLFSDVIKLSYINATNKKSVDVDLIRTGIAWESDKKYKFKNPPLINQTKEALQQAFMDANYVRPKNWRQDIWELDPENLDNNGLQNEDLMVWMRTAALPNFRKLYRRINHTGELETELPDAQFKFTIDYLFDVKSFSGTKSVILANTSVLGGKNPFLGIAYIVVGCICLAIAAICLYVHLRYGKSMMTETML